MSCYAFDRCSVDTDRFMLRRDDIVVELPAIPFQILVLLIERGGDLLTRAEIANAIWPGLDVRDVTHRINTAVNRIRACVEEDPANPRYIQTVIGKGYRFEGVITKPLLNVPPELAPEASTPTNLTPESRLGVKKPLAFGALLLVAMLIVMSVFGLKRSRSEPLVPSVLQTTSLQQLTFNQSANQITAVAISPDGLIAFADADGVRLKRRDQLDSDSVKTPPKFIVDHIAWFSDEKRLAVSGRGSQDDASQVWLLSLSGDAPTQLPFEASFGVPSPVGTRFAFVDAIHSSIWIMDALGQPPRRLIVAGPDESFSMLLWTPDAQRLLTCRKVPPRTVPTELGDLARYNGCRFQAIDPLSGGISAEVDNFDMEEGFFNPAGNLTYTTAFKPGRELWTVPVKFATGGLTATPHITYMLDQSTHALSMSKRGELAGIVRSQKPQIMVGQFNFEQAKLTSIRPVTFFSNESFPHGWLPDQSGLYFESKHEGHFRIFRQTFNQHNAVALTATPEEQVLPLATSDGKWILFLGRNDSGTPFQLYRLSTTNSTPELIDMAGRVGNITCPPKAPTCFTLRVEGQSRAVLHRLDPITGPSGSIFSEVIPSLVPSLWSVSSDGKKAAFVQGEAPHYTLEVFQLSSSKKLSVRFTVPAQVSTLSWLPGRDAWMVTVLTPTGATHYILRTDGHLALVRRTSTVSWCDPSPDGRQIAFADQNLESNVWITSTNRLRGEP